MAVVAAWLWLSSPASSQDAGPRPASTPAVVAGTQPTASEIERATAELADARWQVRRDAGFRLIDAGDKSIPSLRRAYRETRNHEVRLRIRELAEAIFANQHVPGQSGFLGIRQRPRLSSIDPRVPQGTSWIEVLEVFRDTAADRAGLRTGDLILRCDGEVIPEDPTGQSFSGLVARHRAGDELTIEVRRAAGDLVRLKTRLGRRPMAVLAMADPEIYESVGAEFDEWWRDSFEATTTRPPPSARPTTTRSRP